MSDLTPEQQEKADAFKRAIGMMSSPKIVGIIAAYELDRRHADERVAEAEKAGAVKALRWYASYAGREEAKGLRSYADGIESGMIPL